MPNVKNKVRLCTTSPMSIFIVENLGGTPFYNRRNDFERLLEKYATNPRYKNFFAMPYFDSALHGLEWHVDPEYAYAVKLSTIAILPFLSLSMITPVRAGMLIVRARIAV